MLADTIWKHCYGRNAVYPHGDHGNALLSRFPIRAFTNHDASIGRFEARGLLHCILDMPDDLPPLHAICVHLGLRETHRRQQLKQLCALIQEEVPPEAPLVVAGWSFGADVSLALDDAAIAGWCPIAPPLRVVPATEMPAGADPRPKLVLSPEHDQFNPPASARERTAAWANTEVREVPGADHFLWGHGRFLVDAVTGFVDRLTAGAG